MAASQTIDHVHEPWRIAGLADGAHRGNSTWAGIRGARDPRRRRCRATEARQPPVDQLVDPDTTWPAAMRVLAVAGVRPIGARAASRLGSAVRPLSPDRSWKHDAAHAAGTPRFLDDVVAGTARSGCRHTVVCQHPDRGGWSTYRRVLTKKSEDLAGATSKFDPLTASTPPRRLRSARLDCSPVELGVLVRIQLHCGGSLSFRWHLGSWALAVTSSGGSLVPL